MKRAEIDKTDYTELGIGVKQDMDMAKRWYMRAASKSHYVPNVRTLLPQYFADDASSTP